MAKLFDRAMSAEDAVMNAPAHFHADDRVEHLRMPPQSVEAEQAVLGGLMLVRPEKLDDALAQCGTCSRYRASTAGTTSRSGARSSTCTGSTGRSTR